MPDQTPPLVDELRRRIADPGACLPRRFDAGQPVETMAAWRARAVAAGLEDGTLGYVPAGQLAKAEHDNTRCDRLTAERDQLRYERRLLGAARRILDRVGKLPHDAAWRYEAADVAQRIVDEIGHPVTDEPALGPELRAELAKVTEQRDAAHTVIERLRNELLDATAPSRAQDAEAAGYAEAVARLRDDERYRNWWTARPGAPGSYPVYWDGPGRTHLADYLETVGPDGIDVESGIGVRSAGRALLEVLQYVALPFEANRAAYRLRCAFGMSDAPQPVNETESSGAAARRLAGELERLLEGLAERGIVPAPDCPVGTAAVDTALAAVDGLESTVRMMEGAVRLARGPAAECGAGCGEGHRYDKTCGLGPVILGPTRRLRERPTVVETQVTEPDDDDSLVWLRGLIARYGEPRLRDAGPSLTWTWPQRGVRISWTGSFGEVYAWSGKRNASVRLTAAAAAADVSAVVALAGLYDNPASEPPEGLQVEALPGLQPVELAHGIGCVVLMLPKTGPRDPAVTVLWAKQARQLATLLLRQAEHADALLRENSAGEGTDG